VKKLNTMFRPSAQFPTQASWISEKRRQGVFVERKIKNRAQSIKLHKPIYLGGGAPSRMYGRPQMQWPTPHEKIQVNMAEILAALKPSKKEIEKKEEKEDFALVERFDPLPPPVDLKALLAMAKGGRKGFGMQCRFKQAFGSYIAYNSGAGKYIQFLSGSAGLSVFAWGAVLASTAEFSSLDILFDEVFIHSVTFYYKARNKYSGTYAATGTAADTSTCLATLFFLPNAAATYSDNSSTFINASVVAQHKIVNLGENWVWKVYNPVKFGRNDPVVEQASGSANAMGWMNFAKVSANYGGFCSVATPLLTGAALGTNTLLENGIPGDYLAHFDVSVRARA